MGINYLVPVLLFFISGFCGLVYEIVWSRMLVLVMGNTTYATSTILAAFMAGLSLGSFYWGKKIDSLKSAPLFVFGFPEIMVGGGALLYAALLPQAARIYLTVVDGYFAGDTWLPAFEQDEWREIERAEHAADEQHAHAFTFLTLVRREDATP